MNCKKRGALLPENSSFCNVCGEPVEESAENQVNIQDPNLADDILEDTVTNAAKSMVTCPKCGNAYMRMQVQKNVHTSTSDGYSASDGCCGYILFGPLGLLCGVGGNQKTNVTETSSKLWACDNCGNTFRDREEIKESTNIRRFITGLLCGFGLNSIYYNIIILFIKKLYVCISSILI